MRLAAIAVVVISIVVGVGDLPGGTNTKAAPGKSRPAPPARPKIVGYADLHTHHMGHLNFDGEWLWGMPSGPIASALAPCDRPVHALGMALTRKAHLPTA